MPIRLLSILVVQALPGRDHGQDLPDALLFRRVTFGARDIIGEFALAALSALVLPSRALIRTLLLSGSRAANVVVDGLVSLHGYTRHYSLTVAARV